MRNKNIVRSSFVFGIFAAAAVGSMLIFHKSNFSENQFTVQTKPLDSTSSMSITSSVSDSASSTTSDGIHTNLPNQRLQPNVSQISPKAIDLQRLEQKYGTTREEHDRYVDEFLRKRKNKETHDAELKKFSETLRANQNSNKLPPTPF